MKPNRDLYASSLTLLCAANCALFLVEHTGISKREWRSRTSRFAHRLCPSFFRRFVSEKCISLYVIAVVRHRMSLFSFLTVAQNRTITEMLPLALLRFHSSFIVVLTVPNHCRYTGCLQFPRARSISDLLLYDLCLLSKLYLLFFSGFLQCIICGNNEL